MFEVRPNRHEHLWIELAELDPSNTKRKHELFDEIFMSNTNDPYLAILDWPAIRFWKDLIDYYPNATVFLTTRDAHGWYKSMSNTIFALTKYYRITDTIMRGPLWYLMQLTHKLYAQYSLINKYLIYDKLKYETMNDIDKIGTTASMFGVKNVYDETFCVNRFNKHSKDVIEYIKKENETRNVKRNFFIFDVSKHGYNELFDGLSGLQKKGLLPKMPDIKEKKDKLLPKTNSSQEFKNFLIPVVRNWFFSVIAVLGAMMAVVAFFIVRCFV